MKILPILAALIALCYGSSIPVIPGDNSHYVEGESRYIWMPNGDGVPHLVDLHETAVNDPLRSAANNEYRLFTRSNPTTSQIVVHGNANTIANSNYNPNLPLKVVAHGWGGSGGGGTASTIRTAFLDRDDCNVIVLDWSTVAGGNYISAVNGAPEVGRFLGHFLIWLLDNAGGNWNGVHLVGFSLGAHVVGNAGRAAHGFPARVTGLDPAGPLWWNSENALRAMDGVHVETIHTDGGVLGILFPIADADFYPNGGRNPQPGCIINNCSHDRAVLLFASSVLTDHFIGHRCVDLDEAQDKICSGNTLNMGNNDVNKRGTGLYGLTTQNSWPY